ncbi:NAD(P)/FAD-dependent oxidoreductase [Pseudarthrobacter enclensis]|uniref:NADPH-dependent 2,4-dienoyl-CoA reductase/sulfur reductase-like enzyme n=1 Tax=Pseudarthrobacter enclensis TaxID=993070 RepID=A0ABT9RTX6_9MICC|nr:FAD-dependent oxidoreductase [Pseudarthrobacter enclensis]MDP9888692.1 NADPH-dependent 2,4-dienoyl-CoA reductase/sulfur reductase-like enzyme [Pseudarthrobacter enclensis]
MPVPTAPPARIVIVGGSVAGARTAQALRSDGFSGELIVIEPEAGEAYDRPPLSKEYLTGSWSRTQLNLIPGGWAAVDATVIRACASGLDVQEHQVRLSDGQAIRYDALVIATGLSPRRLVADDGESIGHVIGTASDADAVREQLREGRHVVAVGGGFIATETASVARELGLTVTIIDRRSTLLERSLGTVVGAHIAATHREHGVDVRTDARIGSIRRDGSGALITLENGEQIQADVLVAGIGSEPNTAWLHGSGIRIDAGVITDARCRAFGAAGVYALGDVAHFYDVHSAKPRRVGHWTNAADQASVVAHNLLHPENPVGYREAPYFWSDQFGEKIQVAGHPDPDAHVDLLTLDGPAPRRVAIYTHGDDDGCGAVVTFGWPRGMVAARRLMPLEPTTAEMLVELEKLAAGARLASVG